MRWCFLVLWCGLVLAQEHHWDFTESTDPGMFLPAEQYRQAVCALPIACVDIFAYHKETDSYLLVYRKTPPAQGMFWLPGGRMYKGESFLAAAQRKCREETGIFATPQRILGVYSTLFPDSAWGCQTHTINIAVFAYAQQVQAQLDQYHTEYRWISLAVPPDNPYLRAVYHDACAFLHKKE